MAEAAAIAGLVLDYRDAARTERCVRNLRARGVGPILVWDNSADGGDSLRALRAGLQGFADVAFEGAGENLGFAAGVNRGLAWIASRWPGRPVLLLNNDALLLEGAVDALARALRESPGAWFAYPNIDHGGRVLGTVHYQRLTGLLAARAIPGSFAYASGCCLLVDPRRCGTGLFDESFFMYGEDMELGHRLAGIPDAMRHVDRLLVLHEGSASSGMASAFYETWMVAGHFRLASKMARGRLDLATLLAARWGVLALRALVRSVRYRSWVPIASLAKGWRLSR